ncbi:SDR family NAD(P)-dependent oxidoreductase [Caulobacter mirabilis]|uniref:Capsule biosynthesis protein CapD n=1 Tax=Caulobacter mirabilis TaxID=69666 RepID=A0A2D2AT11_9CAUL|nr:nucleoside-diphosphate sugar epimerase/dehydratase [Caulobacter mirabilis]ATQ41131.1 capsule biosynthesis protein CapD [Caulobacter mirabilis]
MKPPISRFADQARKYALHVFLVFAAFVVAYEVRRGLPLEWWVTNPEALRVLRWAALYAAIAAVVELVSRTERAAWRFSSARELLALFRSVTITSALFLGTIFLVDRGLALPRSVLLLAWLISLVFLVGVRIVWRMAYDRSLALSMFPFMRPSRNENGLLVVGEIGDAESYLRSVSGAPDPAYAPLAIVSTSPQDVGLQMHGVAVLATTKDLLALAGAEDVKGKRFPAILFLREPIGHLGLSAETLGELKAAGHRLLRLPSIVELGDEQGGGGLLREMVLEDFLARPPVRLDTQRIRNLVEGRRVLVTGAGGSIGSEIARQLVAMNCSHITLLDHSEHLLFEINRQIERLSGTQTSRPFLCNVRDKERVEAVFLSERPELVFHAAALKHVTLVEKNVCEGVLTNVLGTANVVDAALAAKARQVVLVSTDKAVAPTSVMGATKRLAEAVLPQSDDLTTQFCAVRFGNVLGSAGSVVPIFRDQIERGGPVTITHPDVERYFMTIPEAVQLVLYATALRADTSGSLPKKYVLEMGEPVKIVDLARQMAALNGKTLGEDIPMMIIGLQPGEKLTEELVDVNEATLERLPGIREILTKTQGADFSAEAIEKLVVLAREDRSDEVLRMISERISMLRGSDLVELGYAK